MISISLLFSALLILILKQFGIIKNPMVVFLVAAIVIATCAFMLKDNLKCPFAQKCPFTFCPLNKNK